MEVLVNCIYCYDVTGDVQVIDVEIGGKRR